MCNTREELKQLVTVEHFAGSGFKVRTTKVVSDQADGDGTETAAEEITGNSGDTPDIQVL